MLLLRAQTEGGNIDRLSVSHCGRRAGRGRETGKIYSVLGKKVGYGQ